MSVFFALIVPLSLLGLSVARNIRLRLNLADEGYLIYGTICLLQGAVPIRDFRAYDPARYYWCALWFLLLGPGYIAARVAMAVLSAGSVVLIVLLAVHMTSSAVVGALLGCLSLGWMFPRHKQVEIFFSTVCCCAMYVLVLGASNAYAMGVLAAIAFAFGLNIFIYFAAATFLIVAFGGVVDPLLFGLKFLTGFSAVFLVYLVIATRAPGFLRCYVDKKILRILRRGSTNLALPQPWPWMSAPQFQRFSPMRRMAFHAIFTLIPISSVLAIVVFSGSTVLATSNSGALALASACTALVYFHHFYSRADLGHLSQTIHPVLVLVAACGHAIFGVAGAIIILCICLVGTITLLYDEGEFPLRNLLKKADANSLEDLGNGVLLPRPMARKLAQMRTIIQTNTPPDSTLFAVPACCGYLVLFDRKTAVYDTFPVYPSTPEGRSDMMAQFIAAAPEAVILSNTQIDRRSDLNFSNNYAELTSYIRENYEIVMENTSETLFLKRAPEG